MVSCPKVYIFMQFRNDRLVSNRDSANQFKFANKTVIYNVPDKGTSVLNLVKYIEAVKIDELCVY